MIVNLLSNAIKFTHEGQVTVYLNHRSVAEGSLLNMRH